MREPVELSALTLATNCGGSDATSGLSVNPALGVATELLVAAGGRSILGETTELIGTEHILIRRAKTNKSNGIFRLSLAVSKNNLNVSK